MWLLNLFKRNTIEAPQKEATIFTISKFDALTCVGYIARANVGDWTYETLSDNLENETLQQFKNRILKTFKYFNVQFIEDF